ncbi:MAG: efflux RND transporter permease subunit [Acidobacteriales bacterium]|nr:efflux RND transporter permease subunit [Terriglobales bacterium]
MAGDDRRYWVERLWKPVLFAIIVLAMVGSYLATRTPVAVFPETNFPRIVVAVDNGVMPIDQMQVIITRPIEMSMNQIPGLQTVRSITSRGSAEIDLFFDWSVDMFQTLQLVNAAIARVQSSLPSTVKINANRLSFASFPILGYSLTSESVPQTKLWELATYDIQPRISHLNGVGTVVVQGGQVPEYRISPDPAKLLATGVTISDILNAVQKTNLIDSPGLIEENHQLVLGLVSGQVHSAEELAKVAIKTTQAGIPVRIEDVATVGPSVQPMYTRVTANGKPAVLLNVNRQITGNTVQVVDAVSQEMADIKKSLPKGVNVDVFYDQSRLVRSSISSVRDAILIGIVLATGVIILFLRDWGSSVVAGLVIPITLAVTLIALYALNQSFNLMTLGGLAAAVGLVIDDAIVVVENIVLHRDVGQSRNESIRSALREVTIPLIGSTVTPIVVFLPLITISGVTGTFFRALAITMSVALLTSLLLALTWTPALSRLLVRRNVKTAEVAPASTREEELERILQAEEATMTGFFGKILTAYERMLNWSLRHPVLLGIGGVILLAISYVSFKTMPSDLLPGLDEGGFVLDYLSPAGTSLSETDRMLRHVEQILAENPDVASTSRRTGLQLGLAAVTEANTGDFTVRLKADAKHSTDEVIDDIRKQVAQEEPALKTEYVQLLGDMIDDLSNAPQPIRINIFDPNAAELATWAPKIADAISKEKGIVDVLNGIENTISGPALLYQVDPATAARAGFMPEEVELDASAMMQGELAATPLILDSRPYPIRVRFQNAENMTVDQINSTVVNSSSGHTATLGGLAQIATVPGETEVTRENLQRNVSVTARLENVDLGTGVKNAKAAVQKLHVPPNIRLQWGGTYQEQQKSFGDLVQVFILALLLVFAVLLFEFQSFSAPLAIVTSAVLSTAGSFLALLITGIGLNISSFMGVIMVVGIVSKNGILLLDAENKFRQLGVEPRQAVVQAGRRRLRPIVMTAMAAVAGMLPLAFAFGAGSQMLQPLAIAVVGGVLISMILSLIVTPVIHYFAAGKLEPAQ